MRTHAATVPDLAAAMLPGPYRVPAYRAVGHIRLTNKTPCGTYRAPGRFESTFVRERLLDAIAARLGVRSRRSAPAQSDRRRRDALRASARYARHRDRARFRRLCRAARQGARGGRMAAALQKNSLQRRAAGESSAPASRCSWRKAGSARSTGCGSASMSDGTVEVVTGAASVGQGMETVIAQICADALGVDYRRVRVVHGQTDRIEYGMGAFASRVTVMTGEATRIAASALRAKAIEVAAELLQAPAGRARHGRRRGGPHRRRRGPFDRSWRDCPRARAAARSSRGRASPGLSAEGWFHAESHELSLWRAHRGGARRSRNRRRRHRALSRRLRRRQGGQSDAGRGTDRRRLRAGHRRRAARGVPLRRARRAAVGDVRRLSHADRARGAAGRSADPRGRAEPAQSAGIEGRGGGRRQCGRRRDRRGDRRCARRAQCRHRASDHAASGSSG